MKLNLNQITILVEDVEKSAAFYKKLGLHLIVDSAPRYVRFECVSGETTFSLHQQEKDTIQGNSTWLYFESTDLDTDVAELKNKGIEIIEMPNDKDWMWREARIEDPDGNLIILFFAGNNRKYPPWRVK